MTTLFYKGKKLVHVEDVNDCIDEQGRSKSDLFNSEGALLTLKGKIPRDKIFKIAVYTYQDIYEEFKLLNKDLEKSKKSNESLTQEKITIQKKEKLNKNVGQKFVKIYEQISDGFIEILDGKPINDKKITKATEIIQEVLKTDRPKLHACIKNLRTTDTYTYHHCFAVSLLMIQALEDLSHYQNEDIYWSIFKTNSDKVNFSKNGIQKYGVGALLHDYGKTMIPKNILNKPDKYTSEEFTIMKKHPMLGVQALVKAKIDDPQVLEIVGNHHASYLLYKDRGQSPLALICNIIDIYDACRSERVYKEAFSMEKTQSILKEESIKHGWNQFIFNTILHQTITKFEENPELTIN